MRDPAAGAAILTPSSVSALHAAPPPSNQPYSRRVLNCLVQNEPGVLSRVSGTLAARGFKCVLRFSALSFRPAQAEANLRCPLRITPHSIDSLVVCTTEVKDLSRMCIVLRGQDGVVEQARRQLEDLVSDCFQGLARRNLRAQS